MGYYHDDCPCENGRVEDIVSPTRTIVNTRTRTRTIRHIHPIEIIDVNRTIIRNEDYYPITRREVDEVVEEDYNCGNDLDDPRCRRRGGGGLFSL